MAPSPLTNHWSTTVSRSALQWAVPLLLVAMVPLAVSVNTDEPFEPLAARCGSNGSGQGAPGPGPEFELWQHPVDAPITDGFRPPSNPYGPGNRGLEYGTEPDDPVSSAAPGIVAFAGQVGGRLFVSIVHPSGLRVTYSYLERIDVELGDVVSRGDLIAAASRGMHLTVRDGGIYVDPLPLMADYRCFTVRLVPLPDPSAALTAIAFSEEG